ncbi:hypothetical protein RN001_006918 [Aquatica leii]|uniref:THAP-type domain-containing protein n=1 Tax=Aquatica leii TaxID=1421715 RepID=A0AAN7PE85_9COLE|nr:hypothetical protein RN001_006918 [Aquatica leii]
MGKGWKKCCVKNCLSTTKINRNLTFHKFPVQYALRARWLNEIGDCRDPKYLYPNLRICGLHFNRSGRKTKFDILPKYLSTVTQDCTNIPLNTCNAVSQDTSLNFNATNENDHSYCIPSTNDLIYKIKILQSKCQSLMTKYVKKVKENAELLVLKYSRKCDVYKLFGNDVFRLVVLTFPN